MDATPTDAPRRARLQPRQMYAFSMATQLGWEGNGPAGVRHALDFFLAHHLRDDGLVRAVVAPDGTCLDEGMVLYDQAFALLGLSAAYQTFSEESLRERALDLLGNLRARLGRPSGGLFERIPEPSIAGRLREPMCERPAGLLHTAPLLSNSHMHLLEATLAWADIDVDGPWLTLAQEIVEIALASMRCPPLGLVLEFFDENWNPLQGIEGSVVEPGHQFEWAWLLMRWGRRVGDPRGLAAGLQLLELGERFGVDASRGVAVNAILSDGTHHHSQARLWPQTERLKAAHLAAQITGDASHRAVAASATAALSKYLATPLTGLWYDTMTADGQLIDKVVPASSFYHLVCAIAELERT
ncbi:MAG: AGE family epimerase/isomerase, partial [Gammaproteobacteria bacterium]